MAAYIAFVAPPGAVFGTTPTGGNIYDRHMREGLRAAGVQAEFIAAEGNWPRSSEADRARLARLLDQLPDRSQVLLDGMIACAAPDVLVPRAQRLRLAVLVHMPLADDVALPADVAAELAGRERQTLRAAEAVVATSHATAERLKQAYGVDVEVVHPGVDPAPLANPSVGGERLLCVASIAPVKGQDVLVAALGQLRNLAWHCRCVGAARDAEFAVSVRGQITQLGLDGRVEIVGALTSEQLNDVYAGSDLLIVPSRAESYGMVVTEALARGIPVIASAVGGLPEAVGTDAGMLITPDDPAELAAALRRWLTDRAERRRLRTSARERRASLASWAEAARRLASVVRQAP